MKNVKKTVISIFIALVLGACNNYFHDLIPPDDNRILSFEVDGQIGAAVITDNTVSAYVAKGTDSHSVIPRISISNKATLIPVTFDYVMAAFPGVNLLETAMRMSGSADVTSFVMEMIEENQNFNIPVLDIPIDFTGPVTMLVVSGQGNIRKYTVEIIVDTGEPRLLNFGFSKYDNAELVIDARCTLNETDRIVTANALYPADMDYLSYKLVPAFQIQGDLLEMDGVPVVSGSTEVQFAPIFGSQEKIIRVTRDGEIKDYTLTITFAEDPDTIRSITDFRFNKTDNPNIAANAVASIINTDNTGTISVQVFYSGAKPLSLTPRFVSPGTVSAGGVTQISGVSSNNFSSQAEYRVVSKNGLYTRIYTVKVEFVSLTDSAPRITAFRFSAALNIELVQDAVGEIGDGLIMIEARYGGAYSPVSLIPEFSAEGLVTVYGSVQVSGASPQDFIRQIKYTVTNPLNPLLTSDYWIQCRMIRDTSSEAAITSFGFYPEDNTGLADEVIGKIDQINGKITVYAPVGSGITARTMFPRFTAAGQVNVEGTAQVSGVSGRIFDAPVTYTAVSANGINSRSYIVTVRELQTTIFVDYNAFGHGDGISWENAFRSLKAACEAAAQFPEGTPKEIWIAAGTYKPGSTADDYFPLSANTSYIGGFAGNETSKSQRNIAANKVIISGDFGGGSYSKRLFSCADTLNGDLSFDALQFTSTSGAANGGGIYAILSSRGVLSVTNCSFDNLRASDSGGAVYVQGGAAIISDSDFSFCYGGAVFVQGTGANIRDAAFSMCNGTGAVMLGCSGETVITRVTVEDSSAVNLSGNGNKTLETVSVKRGGGVNVQNSAGNLRIYNSDLTDISGNGIYINNLSGNAEINVLDLRNISGYGIYCGSSSPGRVQLSGVTANAISGSYAVSLALTQGIIIIGNSTFANKGINLSTGASGLVDVSNTNITTVTSGDALTVNAANIVIDRVNIDGVPNGRGMNITNNGRADISNIIINNCVTAANGGGIYMTGSGDAAISYATITRCTAASHGGGMVLSGSGNVSVSNTTIDTVALTSTLDNNGGGIYHFGGSLSVVNCVIKNITGNAAPCAGIHTLSSANLEVSGLELQNISGYGIYCTLSGTRYFSGITAVTGIGVAYGIYVDNMSSGSFTLTDSRFTSCGVYCYASNAVPIQVTGTEIRNAKSFYGLSTRAGGGTITIDSVTIDGVPNGGGILASSNNTISISNSTIKNCVTSQTGGGIYISNGENNDIYNTVYNTVIENVEVVYGGGICFSGGNNLTINGCTIKNAKAKYGGGLDVTNSASLININDTTMELCVAEFSGGAIYSNSNTINISNSRFINCTAGNDSKIFYGHSFGVIRNCEFTHNAALPNLARTTDGVVSLFGAFGGNFEDCTFNNLCGNMPLGQNYLFNRWSAYPSDSNIGYIITYLSTSLILKNCTFNIKSGSAGIMALYGGQVSGTFIEPSYLLMDNVTINDNGGQRPLIWLYNSPNGSSTPGTLQFKANNTYNGTLLNSLGAITGLSGSGVLSLTNGAMPVIVP